MNSLCCNKYRYSTVNAQLCLLPLTGPGEENEIQFIFICQTLNLLRDVCLYTHMCGVNDPTVCHVPEMLLPGKGVNLAKFNIEAEKVNRAASENCNVEKKL